MLENIIGYAASNRAYVGDLFLTAKGLYFVAYSAIGNPKPLYGKFGGALATAIGGWQGGLSAIISDRSAAATSISNAVGKAASHRKNEWGVTIQERSAKHGNIFFSRESIKNYRFRGHNIEIATDKGEIVLSRAKSVVCWDKLTSYLKGINSEMPDKHLARYGLNIDLPAPSVIFESEKENKLNVPEDLAKKMSQNKVYMQGFWSVFENSPKKRNASLLNSMLNASSYFKAAFREYSEEMVIKKRKTTLKFIGLFILDILFALAYLLYFQHLTTRDAPFLILLPISVLGPMAVLLGWGYFLILAIQSALSMRRYKKFAEETA